MAEKNRQTEKDFIIRSYEKGDEIKINEMFNEVFRQNRDISHWHWKYRDNPNGPAVISLAESAEGIFAAHFGAYPLKLCYFPPGCTAPEESTIYHAGDKMTRREFRSAGFGKSSLLARTFHLLAEAPKQPDNAFTFGFMSHHSLRFGLLLLNYKLIEPIPYRRLEWNRLSEIRISPYSRLLKGIRAEHVSVADETWTEFFSRVASDYAYLVKRDSAYITWRYLQRPDRQYFVVGVKRRSKLAGWSVFFREGNKIIWGDALYTKGDLDCVRASLIFLRTHPFAEGAEHIECWFPPRPAWWDSILRSLGFKNETEPNNLCFCIGIIKDNNALERSKNMLYYTKGDSDLF